MFKELMQESRQREVLEMARLTDNLPAEAKRKKTGITDPKEAWEKLYDRYGDRNLSVIAAMRELTQMKMSQGHACKKVEALVQCVRMAKP